MSDDEIRKLRQQLAQMSDLYEAERASKRMGNNLDFVQVSRQELRAIGELGEKNPLALKLLMTFAQSMDKQNAIMISFKAMEALMKKSRPTIDRAIRVLKEGNWIQVIKVGTANAYVLNSAVFWTDKSHKKMSVFSAQVITTLDEQDKDLRKSPDVKLKRVPTIQANERLSLNTDEELPPPDQKDLDLS